MLNAIDPTFITLPPSHAPSPFLHCLYEAEQRDSAYIAIELFYRQKKQKQKYEGQTKAARRCTRKHTKQKMS